MSSELGPEAQAILEAGRDGDDPTAADRARVRASLVQVIAAGGVGVAAAAVGKTAAASMAPKAAAGALAKTAPLGAALAGKLVAVVALTSAVGGGVWYASTRPSTANLPLVTQASTATQTPAATPPSTAPRPADEPALAAPPADVPSEEAAPAAQDAPGAEPAKPPGVFSLGPQAAPNPTSLRDVEARRAPPAGATASADPLEAEARRLRGAHAAIQAGDAERALADLDAQNRAYAGGQLGEERSATRVLALCKLGRANEAKAAAARFIADHPRSPLVDRMRTPCSEGR